MSNLQVIPALKGDLPAFALMEQHADTLEFIDAYDLATHEQRFLEPSIVYLKIKSAGKRVGFFLLSLDQDGRSVEFRRVVIEAQARGIGQAAINLMEAYCEQTLNRQRIWLDVYDANVRGVHIYKKLGYAQFNKDSNNLISYYAKDL